MSKDEIRMTGPQRDTIAISLRLLEQALVALDQAIREPFAQLRLTHYANPVSAVIAQHAIQLASEANGYVRRISDELAFDPHEESIVNGILGNLHVRVVDVAELRPRFLRGGGHVSESLAGYIQPRAIELENVLRRLIRLLESQDQLPRSSAPRE